MAQNFFQWHKEWLIAPHYYILHIYLTVNVCVAYELEEGHDHNKVEAVVTLSLNLIEF